MIIKFDKVYGQNLAKLVNFMHSEGNVQTDSGNILGRILETKSEKDTGTYNIQIEVTEEGTWGDGAKKWNLRSEYFSDLYKIVRGLL